MDTDIKRAIITAVSDAIENMAFTNVAYAADEAPNLDGDFVWSKIDVTEPTTGEMFFIFSRAKANELVLAMFATEMTEEELAAARHDVLNELANTISGESLLHLVSDTEKSRVGLPSNGDGFPMQIGEADYEELAFEFDDEDLFFMYYRIDG